MADERTDGWPSGLTPLRPEPRRRRRLRAGIAARARDELGRRERRAVLDVASGWTRRILPLAAAVTLAFGWAAFHGGAEPPATERITAERLVDPDSSGALPGILVNRPEPSTNRVLQSVVYEP